MSRHPLYFIFTLHNHQPVGNFDHVFQEAYEKSYLPFLDLFEKTTKLKMCLHTSGPLMDWLEKNQPKYLKRIQTLAVKGRLEILSGGYYEPILSSIRSQDALGQMSKMNNFIKSFFKQTPKGFWLTERVWEPSFPTIAADAGLTYTTLDDTHFFYAGAAEGEMDGYFTTENQGNVLNVFPISKELRYAVPFKTVHEVYEYFKLMHKEGRVLLNLADDGEKFGLWPGTYNSVYEEKWLKYFFKMLEDSSDWLKTVTYSEALQILPPKRRIYLPTASYEEMTEWSMGSEQQLQYQNFKDRLKKSKTYDDSKLFIRSGFFRNFFAKYSESAAMQDKQFYVSQKVSRHTDTSGKKARDELYQGECNCPYWHGIFGGIYLNHLRRATYQHLIRAEKLADNRSEESYQPRQIQIDFNLDGKDEYLWETRDINLVVVPHKGAKIVEWDDLPSEMNLLNVITRRFEPYHDEIRKKGVSEAIEEVSNIHHVKRQITQEIVDNLVFDSYDRASWVDHIFKSGNLKKFKNSKLDHDQVLVSADFRPVSTSDARGFQTEFVYGGSRYQLTKYVRPDCRKLHFRTQVKRLEGKGSMLCVGSEWNFNFCTKESELDMTTEWRVWDEWSNLGAVIRSKKPFAIWQYPLMTISQSEAHYDLKTQGACLLPHWNIDLSSESEVEWQWEIEIKES